MIGACAIPSTAEAAMTQEPVSTGDERVAQVVEAARELVDAYKRRATSNEHFQALERAVDALHGSGGAGAGGAPQGAAAPAPAAEAEGPGS